MSNPNRPITSREYKLMLNTDRFADRQKGLESKKKDKNTLEQFQPEVVAGTNRFFRTVQKQRGWLNLNGTTKTAYAFDAL